MIKAKVWFKYTDRGWKDMVESMKRMHGSHVTVGIHEDQGSYPDGTNVAQVAAWDEFGTEHAPERSFIRSTIDEHEETINDWRAEFVEKIQAGTMTPMEALQTLGHRVEELIRKKIASGPFAPNAPSTLRAKAADGAGSQPLQWTRKLISAVAYKVVLK